MTGRIGEVFITGDSLSTVDMSPVAGAGGPGEVKARAATVRTYRTKKKFCSRGRWSWSGERGAAIRRRLLLWRDRPSAPTEQRRSSVAGAGGPGEVKARAAAVRTHTIKNKEEVL